MEEPQIMGKSPLRIHSLDIWAPPLAAPAPAATRPWRSIWRRIATQPQPSTAAAALRITILVEFVPGSVWPMCSVSGQSVSPYAKCQQFHSSSTAVEHKGRKGKGLVKSYSFSCSLHHTLHTTQKWSQSSASAGPTKNKEGTWHLLHHGMWYRILYQRFVTTVRVSSLLSTFLCRAEAWCDSVAADKMPSHLAGLDWAGLGWAGLTHTRVKWSLCRNNGTGQIRGDTTTRYHTHHSD